MSARSYLFVPGERPDRFDKACASGADVVILDLEDAVAPERKAQAREAVRDWLSCGGQAWVRLNGSDTPWYEADCSLLNAPGLLGISLPKAETVEQLRRLAERLPAKIGLLPIIETARGVWNVAELTAVLGVTRLAFGSVDFQADTGIVGEGRELLYARSRLVIASAMARIEPPVDGVNVQLDDAARLDADVLDARRMGFGGKLCVHPRQVGPVNQGFLPSAEEVDWARAVMDIVEANTGVGAISFEGKLIDQPVFLRAKRILEGAAGA